MTEHLRCAVFLCFALSGPLLPAEDSPVVTEARAELARFVGVSEAELVQFAVTDAAAPEDESFRIAARGGVITVTGGRRGILWGVYELLEKYAGVEFLAPDCTHVPADVKLAVPDGTEDFQAPAFETRDLYWYPMMNDAAYARRLRLNRDTQPQWSSKLWKCHTFFKLVPPEIYAKDHPEYYSEINGRRIGVPSETNRGQLCTTNPDVIEIAASNLLEVMRSEPEAKYFAVSQMDWQHFCDCAACRAVKEEEGGVESGPYVRFVNAVADRVRDEFPDKVIVMNAYFGATKPPRTALRPNAGTFYAESTHDVARPFGRGPYARNLEIPGELAGWGELTDELHIWDYTTTFTAYPVPLPNVRTFAENLRCFRRAKAKHMFQQGAWQGNLASFAVLKTWLLAHLQWNPDQDVDALVARFVGAYYGAAAHQMLLYFNLIEDQPARHPEITLVGNATDENCPFLTPEILKRSVEILEKAADAVKDDPVRTGRVCDELFGVTFVRLMRCSRPLNLSREMAEMSASGALRDEVEALLRMREMRKPVQLAESYGQSDAYWQRLRAMVEAYPESARTGVAVAEESAVGTVGLGTAVEVVDDPLAADGRAYRIFGTEGEWCVQDSVSKMLAWDIGARCRLRLRLRADLLEGADPNGIVAACGIYEPSSGRMVVMKTLSVADFSGSGEYRWYDAFEWEPSVTQNFWLAPGGVGPGGKRDFSNVYLDQVEVNLANENKGGKEMTHKTVVAALAAMLAFASPGADAIRVNPDGTGDYPDIPSAISAVEPGAVIELAPGTYPGGLQVTKSVTLKGSGRGRTIIDADNKNRCIIVNSGVNDVAIRDLTVRNGSAGLNYDGGGVCADGGTGIVVVDCTIDSCQARNGGGIYSATPSGVAAVRCLFTGCESLNDYGTGSAGVCQADAFYCVFSRTYSTHQVANAPVAGPCKVVNCTFANNALYHFIKGDVSAYNCLFTSGSYRLGTADDTLYNCVTYTDPTLVIATYGADSKVGQNDIHFVNMATDDYRLVTTSAAAAAGGAAHLDLIPEAYRYTDFYGQAVDPAGAVNAGCSAVGTVAPQGARIELRPYAGFVGTMEIDGVTVEVGSGNCSTYLSGGNVNFYFHSETWPAFHAVRFLGTDGGKAWGLIASGNDTVVRYPEPDGSFVFMPPPSGDGRSLRLAAQAVETELYVDADSTAATPDGTVGNEYKDIQDAVDAIAGGKYAIIHVAAGTYDHGGNSHTDVYGVPVIMSRVNVTGKKIRFIGAGADSTFIVGEPDPSATDAEHGCGSGATRCFTTGDIASLEGFTLTGGHTAKGASIVDCYGGAASAAGPAARLRICDCVISNNTASFASSVDATYAGGKAIVSRCKVLNNYTIASCCWAKGIVSQSTLWAFNKGLGTADTRDAPVWSGNPNTFSCADVYDSTWYAVADSRSFQGYIMSTAADGTVVRNTLCVGSGMFGFHCADGCAIEQRIPREPDGVEKTTYAPDLTGTYAIGVGTVGRFVDPAGYDFRVKASSLAKDLAFYAPDNGAPEAYIYATKSLDGVWPDFTENGGRFTSGAYRKVVPVVTVAADSHIVPKLDDAPLTPGETVEFSFDGTRTHPSLIVVNGKTVAASGDGFSYAVPADGGESLVLSEVNDPNVHVANDGDDAACGTAGHPKRTLKGGLAIAASGETVHVAEGVYASDAYGTGNVLSRAIVPSGVTLQADGAAEKTVIVGAPAPQADDYGFGVGAVRCVTFRGSGLVKGFTLTGGVGYDGTSGGYTDGGAGGAVFGTASSVVEDCIVSNNIAFVGGAGLYGTYRRCRFFENRATGNSAALSQAYACNCVFDRNLNASTTDAMHGIDSCTFGPDNRALNGENLAEEICRYNVYSSEKTDIHNLLFLGNVISFYGNDHDWKLVNCAIVSTATVRKASIDQTGTWTFVDCVTDKPADELQVDAEYRPVVGANAAVSRGGKDAYDLAACGDLDVCGQPRFQNGLTLDPGAAEADWKAAYARKLGRAVTVTQADPEVSLTDAGVRLPAGATLSLSAGTQEGCNHSFCASVTDGVLAVGKDGQPWKEIDALSSGKQTFAGTGDAVDLTFGMGDFGSTVLSAFRKETGALLILR